MSDPGSKSVQVAHGQALSSRYPSGNRERGRGRDRPGPSENQANYVFPTSVSQVESAVVKLVV